MIYMIRIRFCGPRELIQIYFSGAQYAQDVVSLFSTSCEASYGSDLEEVTRSERAASRPSGVTTREEVGSTSCEVRCTFAPEGLE